MGIYGAELEKQYPEKFAALASLPLPEIPESIQEIRYCRDALSDKIYKANPERLFQETGLRKEG